MLCGVSQQAISDYLIHTCKPCRKVVPSSALNRGRIHAGTKTPSNSQQVPEPLAAGVSLLPQVCLSLTLAGVQGIIHDHETEWGIWEACVFGFKHKIVSN